MARTTRTCSLAAALAAVAVGATPATASTRQSYQPSSATTFVGARAAELSGDPRRAAMLYAMLAQSDPTNGMVADRAISQAISAGDTALALRLARGRPAVALGLDSRMLLTADRLARGKTADALSLLRSDSDSGTLSFLAPAIEAWAAAERRNPAALELISRVPAGSIVAPYVTEHRALILLRLKRSADASPLIERALAQAGGRESRLRLAFADGLFRAGDKAAAAKLLSGSDPVLARARGLIERNKRPGGGIEDPATAFAELLSIIALDLSRADARSLPIAMVQVARVADPQHPTLPLLLGLLLGESKRQDDALAVLRGLPGDSLFADAARDTEVRILIRDGRLDEAAARAQAFVSSSNATADDWSRLGDVLDELERHGPAAEAFARAIALTEAGQPGPKTWQLYMLRGAMLERADRWPEAKQALARARALAPDNPLVLNLLGYAQLERGENLDGAEALIGEASRRAPDDASITDSLGWAQFKRGRVEEAIATLERAAAKDVSQAEIHEHLGDALYTAGRKFEARHAWNAALITAEDEIKTRVQAKLLAGLQPANAAP